MKTATKFTLFEHVRPNDGINVAGNGLLVGFLEEDHVKAQGWDLNTCPHKVMAHPEYRETPDLEARMRRLRGPCVVCGAESTAGYQSLGEHFGYCDAHDPEHARRAADPYRWKYPVTCDVCRKTFVVVRPEDWDDDKWEVMRECISTCDFCMSEDDPMCDPCSAFPSGVGGRSGPADDVSPWQANAIRAMEG